MVEIIIGIFDLHQIILEVIYLEEKNRTLICVKTKGSFIRMGILVHSSFCGVDLLVF